MSFVGVDMGASNTRFVDNTLKFDSIPNNMFLIKDIDRRIDLLPESDENGGIDLKSALDITITKTEGATDFFPTRALIGSMAERYNSSNVRPSMAMNKHKQEINYISVLVSAAIAKLESKLADDEMELNIALPPIEVNYAKDYMKEQLSGKFELQFNKYNNTVITLNITEVYCYEESYLAAIAFRFDLSGKVREEAKPYLKSTMLSLDIGASTSDLATIKDGKYLEKSGQTYKNGGNVIRDIVKDSIREIEGYEIDIEASEKLISTGLLPYGNKTKDYSQQLKEAKIEFSSRIVNDMQTYFTKTGVPLQSIQVILVSGGGSMRSEYMGENNEIIVTTPPTSDFITDQLKVICPGVDVIAYKENPRMANCIGLAIRGKANALLKARKLAEQSAVLQTKA